MGKVRAASKKHFFKTRCCCHPDFPPLSFISRHSLHRHSSHRHSLSPWHAHSSTSYGWFCPHPKYGNVFVDDVKWMKIVKGCVKIYWDCRDHFLLNPCRSHNFDFMSIVRHSMFSERIPLYIPFVSHAFHLLAPFHLLASFIVHVQPEEILEKIGVVSMCLRCTQTV